MKSVKKVKSEITDMGQVKSIIEVFEEISAIRMKDIRDEILASREFLEKLSNLSEEVGSDLYSTVNMGGTATIYLSASSGMYGDLPEKVFTSFLDHVTKNKTDIFIFGSQGKNYVEKYRPSLKFTFFELDDRKSVQELLKECLKPLINFSKITVFYGKYNNLINQVATSSSIMGDFLESMGETSKKELAEKQFKYLYEPTVLEVSNVFANEIKTSIIEGVIKENNLAKTGSRLMHLDQAYENIEKKLDILRIVKNRETKRLEDKKQQERIKRLWL